MWEQVVHRSLAYLVAASGAWWEKPRGYQLPHSSPCPLEETIAATAADYPRS